MRKRNFLYILLISLLFVFVETGCSSQKSGNTTKVIKPKTRKYLYKPNKHKRLKRTKTVKMK